MITWLKDAATDLQAEEALQALPSPLLYRTASTLRTDVRQRYETDIKRLLFQPGEELSTTLEKVISLLMSWTTAASSAL